MFDIWMNILKKVNNSVLWLLESNLKSRENLKNQVDKRGMTVRELYLLTVCL